MRGHIKKRAKGSWSIVVDRGRDPVTGKRRQLWRTVKGTKKQAEAALAQIISQLEAGHDLDPSRVTISEYTSQWLVVNEARLAPSTSQRYERLFRVQVQPHLGALQLTKLRPLHLQHLYKRLLDGWPKPPNGPSRPQSSLHSPPAGGEMATDPGQPSRSRNATETATARRSCPDSCGGRDPPRRRGRVLDRGTSRPSAWNRAPSGRDLWTPVGRCRPRGPTHTGHADGPAHRVRPAVSSTKDPPLPTFDRDPPVRGH